MPSPAPRDRHLQWPATLLLHGLLIAAAILLVPPQPPLSPPSQSSVSIVTENSGAPRTTAPPPRLVAPPAPAVTPPAAPPPPAAEETPESSLGIPDDLFSQYILPDDRQAASRPAPRPARQRIRHPRYQVMNGMSLGNPPSPTQQPPMPQGLQGLNTQLSQSDLNAMLSPQLSIQGDVSADYDAMLQKWVQDHGYYPQAAAEQNQSGSVTVEFTLHRDGHVTGLRMLSGSGSVFLDQAWSGLFRNNRLPRFPPGGADSITVIYTGEFILEP